MLKTFAVITACFAGVYLASGAAAEGRVGQFGWAAVAGGGGFGGAFYAFLSDEQKAALNAQEADSRSARR